mmetsp:Transcript_10415/g.22547  ORF Transcript_10415/g.22547 Transcript_10415/m.22547 type:complete len:396 (+) Transcript_10415:925-2112(+)
MSKDAFSVPDGVCADRGTCTMEECDLWHPWDYASSELPHFKWERNVAVAGGTSGAVVCYLCSTGERVWAAGRRAHRINDITVACDAPLLPVVVAATGSSPGVKEVVPGSIFARVGTTGVLLWEQKHFNDWVLCVVAVPAANVVVFGARDKRVGAVHLLTGDVVWGLKEFSPVSAGCGSTDVDAFVLGHLDGSLTCWSSGGFPGLLGAWQGGNIPPEKPSAAPPADPMSLDMSELLIIAEMHDLDLGEEPTKEAVVALLAEHNCLPTQADDDTGEAERALGPPKRRDPLWRAKGHDAVRTVAVGPRGSGLLFTGGSEATVAMWKFATGERVFLVAVGFQPASVVWSGWRQFDPPDETRCFKFLMPRALAAADTPPLQSGDIGRDSVSGGQGSESQI